MVATSSILLFSGVRFVLGVASSADRSTVSVSLLWQGLGVAAADSFYLTGLDVSVCEWVGLQASIWPCIATTAALWVQNAVCCPG